MCIAAVLTAAGIYYAKDSWKARLCVEGRDLLYAFCEQYRVPYKKCGKLIVASSSQHQIAQLRGIAKRGVANGVSDLQWMSQERAKEIEPHVECQEVSFPFTDALAGQLSTRVVTSL